MDQSQAHWTFPLKGPMPACDSGVQWILGEIHPSEEGHRRTMCNILVKYVSFLPPLQKIVQTEDNSLLLLPACGATPLYNW